MIAVFAILRPAIVLARPQWRLWPQISQLMQAVFVLILIKYINAALGHVPSDNWYPFVILADSVKNAGQYIRIAAIVNVSILIALAATWFGVSIGIIAHIWELMKEIRKPAPDTRQPASLQAR